MRKERLKLWPLAASGAPAVSAHPSRERLEYGLGDLCEGAGKISTLSLLLSCARQNVNRRRKAHDSSSRRSPHKERTLPTPSCARTGHTPIHRDAYPEKGFRGPDTCALRRGAIRLLQFNCAVVCVSLWQPRSTDTVHHARCSVPIQGNGH